MEEGRRHLEMSKMWNVGEMLVQACTICLNVWILNNNTSSRYRNFFYIIWCCNGNHDEIYNLAKNNITIASMCVRSIHYYYVWMTLKNTHSHILYSIFFPSTSWCAKANTHQHIFNGIISHFQTVRFF